MESRSSAIQLPFAYAIYEEASNLLKKLNVDQVLNPTAPISFAKRNQLDLMSRKLQAVITALNIKFSGGEPVKRETNDILIADRAEYELVIKFKAKLIEKQKEIEEQLTLFNEKDTRKRTKQDVAQAVILGKMISSARNRMDNINKEKGLEKFEKIQRYQDEVLNPLFRSTHKYEELPILISDLLDLGQKTATGILETIFKNYNDLVSTLIRTEKALLISKLQKDQEEKQEMENELASFPMQDMQEEYEKLTAKIDGLKDLITEIASIEVTPSNQESIKALLAGTTRIIQATREQYEIISTQYNDLQAQESGEENAAENIRQFTQTIKTFSEEIDHAEQGLSNSIVALNMSLNLAKTIDKLENELKGLADRKEQINRKPQAYTTDQHTALEGAIKAIKIELDRLNVIKNMLGETPEHINFSKLKQNLDSILTDKTIHETIQRFDFLIGTQGYVEEIENQIQLVRQLANTPLATNKPNQMTQVEQVLNLIGIIDSTIRKNPNKEVYPQYGLYNLINQAINIKEDLAKPHFNAEQTEQNLLFLHKKTLNTFATFLEKEVLNDLNAQRKAISIKTEYSDSIVSQPISSIPELLSETNVTLTALSKLNLRPSSQEKLKQRLAAQNTRYKETRLNLLQFANALRKFKKLSEENQSSDQNASQDITAEKLSTQVKSWIEKSSPENKLRTTFQHLLTLDKDMEKLLALTSRIGATLATTESLDQPTLAIIEQQLSAIEAEQNNQIEGNLLKINKLLERLNTEKIIYDNFFGNITRLARETFKLPIYQKVDSERLKERIQYWKNILQPDTLHKEFNMLSKDIDHKKDLIKIQKSFNELQARALDILRDPLYNQRQQIGKIEASFYDSEDLLGNTANLDNLKQQIQKLESQENLVIEKLRNTISLMIFPLDEAMIKLTSQKASLDKMVQHLVKSSFKSELAVFIDHEQKRMHEIDEAIHYLEQQKILIQQNSSNFDRVELQPIKSIISKNEEFIANHTNIREIQESILNATIKLNQQIENLTALQETEVPLDKTGQSALIKILLNLLSVLEKNKQPDPDQLKENLRQLNSLPKPLDNEATAQLQDLNSKVLLGTANFLFMHAQETTEQINAQIEKYGFGEKTAEIVDELLSKQEKSLADITKAIGVLETLNLKPSTEFHNQFKAKAQSLLSELTRQKQQLDEREEQLKTQGVNLQSFDLYTDIKKDSVFLEHLLTKRDSLTFSDIKYISQQVDEIESTLQNRENFIKSLPVITPGETINIHSAREQTAKLVTEANDQVMELAKKLAQHFEAQADNAIRSQQVDALKTLAVWLGLFSNDPKLIHHWNTLSKNSLPAEVALTLIGKDILSSIARIVPLVPFADINAMQTFFATINHELNELNRLQPAAKVEANELVMELANKLVQHFEAQADNTIRSQQVDALSQLVIKLMNYVTEHPLVDRLINDWRSLSENNISPAKITLVGKDILSSIAQIVSLPSFANINTKQAFFADINNELNELDQLQPAVKVEDVEEVELIPSTNVAIGDQLLKLARKLADAFEAHSGKDTLSQQVMTLRALASALIGKNILGESTLTDELIQLEGRLRNSLTATAITEIGQRILSIFPLVLDAPYRDVKHVQPFLDKVNKLLNELNRLQPAAKVEEQVPGRKRKIENIENINEVEEKIDSRPSKKIESSLESLNSELPNELDKLKQTLLHLRTLAKNFKADAILLDKQKEALSDAVLPMRLRNVQLNPLDDLKTLSSALNDANTVEETTLAGKNLLSSIANELEQHTRNLIASRHATTPDALKTILDLEQPIYEQIQENLDELNSLKSDIVPPGHLTPDDETNYRKILQLLPQYHRDYQATLTKIQARVAADYPLQLDRPNLQQRVRSLRDHFAVPAQNQTDYQKLQTWDNELNNPDAGLIAIQQELKTAEKTTLTNYSIKMQEAHQETMRNVEIAKTAINRTDLTPQQKLELSHGLKIMADVLSKKHPYAEQSNALDTFKQQVLTQQRRLAKDDAVLATLRDNMARIELKIAQIQSFSASGELLPQASLLNLAESLQQLNPRSPELNTIVDQLNVNVPGLLSATKRQAIQNNLYRLQNGDAPGTGILAELKRKIENDRAVLTDPNTGLVALNAKLRNAPLSTDDYNQLQAIHEIDKTFGQNIGVIETPIDHLTNFQAQAAKPSLRKLQSNFEKAKNLIGNVQEQLDRQYSLLERYRAVPNPSKFRSVEESNSEIQLTEKILSDLNGLTSLETLGGIPNNQENSIKSFESGLEKIKNKIQAGTSLETDKELNNNQANVLEWANYEYLNQDFIDSLNDHKGQIENIYAQKISEISGDDYKYIAKTSSELDKMVKHLENIQQDVNKLGQQPHLVKSLFAEQIKQLNNFINTIQDSSLKKKFAAVAKLLAFADRSNHIKEHLQHVEDSIIDGKLQEAIDAFGTNLSPSQQQKLDNLMEFQNRCKDIVETLQHLTDFSAIPYAPTAIQTFKLDVPAGRSVVEEGTRFLQSKIPGLFAQKDQTAETGVIDSTQGIGPANYVSNKEDQLHVHALSEEDVFAFVTSKDTNKVHAIHRPDNMMTFGWEMVPELDAWVDINGMGSREHSIDLLLREMRNAGTPIQVNTLEKIFAGRMDKQEAHQLAVRLYSKYEDIMIHKSSHNNGSFLNRFSNKEFSLPSVRLLEMAAEIAYKQREKGDVFNFKGFDFKMVEALIYAGKAAGFKTLLNVSTYDKAVVAKVLEENRVAAVQHLIANTPRLKFLFDQLRDTKKVEDFLDKKVIQPQR